MSILLKLIIFCPSDLLTRFTDEKNPGKSTKLLSKLRKGGQSSYSCGILGFNVSFGVFEGSFRYVFYVSDAGGVFIFSPEYYFFLHTGLLGFSQIVAQGPLPEFFTASSGFVYLVRRPELLLYLGNDSLSASADKIYPSFL